MSNAIEPITDPRHYYTGAEIRSILDECGIDEEELEEYIEFDFVEEGDDVPSAEYIADHITYQKSLVMMARESEDEHDFSYRWCMAN